MAGDLSYKIATVRNDETKSNRLQDIGIGATGKDADFADRLRILLAMAPSKTAFARMIGITPTTLWAYLGRRGCDPSLTMVRRIAEKTGADPQWLAFGRGRTPDVSKLAGRIAERLAAERQSERKCVV